MKKSVSTIKSRTTTKIALLTKMLCKLAIKLNKNKLFSTLLLFAAVGCFVQMSFAQDSRNSGNTKPKRFPGREAKSLTTVRDCGPYNASSTIRQTPECTDTRFWVDVDAGLDTGCTFQEDSPLTFTIKIDRYFGDIEKLKANNLIGNTVTLRLPAYDVDYNGSGSGGNPERDRLSINGHIIGDLQGNNDIWHLNEFTIPIDWLHFPTTPGTVANNNLRIDIDRLNGDWCVGADWAAVDVRAARPALFVHGILSGSDTWSVYENTFENVLGLPHSAIDMGFFPDTIGNNSAKISQEVERLKQLWKVDKINLIAHSKGGLDSRDYAELSDSVSQVIQIGTPNAGSPLADAIIGGSFRLPLPYSIAFNAFVFTQGPGSYQLTRPYMVGYNALHSYNQEVRYTALAGVYTPDPSCLLCLDALERPFAILIGEGDLIVPKSSVHSLPFTRNLTVSTGSPNREAIHINQTSSQAIYNALKPSIGLLDSTESRAPSLSPSGNTTTPPSPTQSASQIGVITQGQTQTKFITVDQTSNVFFTMMYYSGNLDMALISPSGQRFDRLTIIGNPNVQVADEEIIGGRAEVFSFNTLEAGVWTVEVEGVSIIEPVGEMSYSIAGWMPVASPIKLSGSFQNQNVRAGNPLRLLASLNNDTTRLTNATVSAIVRLPNQTQQTVALFDDGTNGDVTANDGIYTFDFTNTSQLGTYQVLFEASRSANGGTPAVSRETLNTASVSGSGSSLTGNYSDFGLDTDSNILFNKLVVQTGVNITNNGNYRIVGTLSDSAGNILSAVKRISLNTGSQNVRLEFDGEQIYRNRVNGTFTLTSLKLLEETGSGLTLLDERENDYQTSSYQFINFEHLPITYNGTGSAVGIDTNGNNRFDILRVTLGIDVTVTGTYNWTAQIIDRNGADLGFATGSGTLTSGSNNIVLNFNGMTIGQANVNGPYTITGLLVYRQNFSLIEGNVLTTPPYRSSQFEGSTLITPTVRLFDFDGDSRTDLSIFRPGLGQWWYQKSSDGTGKAVQFGLGDDKIVPADFTGDGITDIAIYRPTTGFWYVLRSEDSSFYSFPFGLNGDIPAPADYDGDGKADAAVFRPSSGIWYISKSSGGTLIHQYGLNGDFPVVADYDGDGKADIAVWRPNTGEWWYLRSSDNTNGIVQFGSGTDKPMQGDYTGDGKADIAFYRPTSPGLGNWFILRSEDLSYYSFPFGTNGDIPVAGDYDGDGKFDAAIFRPSSATWYIQNSTAGTSIQTFGANGDLPVPNAFVP